jgi:gamma-glutamylcyclotransferase (GGCT)/AIG2-like uncharacterized protein YtfP
MPPLFAYGTLMDPEILTAVTGHARRGCPARLAGYRRFLVRGTQYPAVVPAMGRRVSGILYRGVSRRDWSRLDRFEGGLYRRQLVRVQIEGGGWVSATVYVLRDEHRQLLSNRPWDFALFQREGKRQFAAEYEGFRAHW